MQHYTLARLSWCLFYLFISSFFEVDLHLQWFAKYIWHIIGLTENLDLK